MTVKHEVPEFIWLQLYGESSPEDGPPPNPRQEEITWCWEPMFEHDIKYRRDSDYQLLQDRLREAEVQRDALWCLLDDIDTASDMFKPLMSDYYWYVNKKQKARWSICDMTDERCDKARESLKEVASE